MNLVLFLTLFGYVSCQGIASSKAQSASLSAEMSEQSSTNSTEFTSANAAAAAIVSAIEAGDMDKATADVVEAIAVANSADNSITATAIAEAIVAGTSETDTTAIAALIAAGDSAQATASVASYLNPCVHYNLVCPSQVRWFKSSGGACYSVFPACFREGYESQKKCEDICY